MTFDPFETTVVESDPRNDPIDILVVDDHERNLVALTAILDIPGYRCVRARSGADALARAAAQSFAVILLDVVMPDMDGLEVAAAIRSQERSRSTPIIFLTASDDDVDRIARAYALGAADYLVKPVQPHVVRAKVGVFVELHRAYEKVKRQAELIREHDRLLSERTLVEERLLGERRYRDLAESIPQLVWRATPIGELTYFSPRWHEYAGVALEGRDDDAWLDVLHPEDRDAFHGRWLASAIGDREFQGQCRLRRFDGSYRWHLCQALPEIDASGGIVGWMGTFTDIDDQKRADDERRGLLDEAERARKKAEAMQRYLAILSRVSQLFCESLDVEEVLGAVARSLVQSLCVACTIEIVADAGGRARIAMANLAASDEQDEPGEETRRQLVASIVSRRGTIGTIAVSLREASPLSRAEEVGLVQDIAQRIASFVENARLLADAERRAEVATQLSLPLAEALEADEGTP